MDESILNYIDKTLEHMVYEKERIEELVTEYSSIRLALIELDDSLGGEYKDYILAEAKKLYEKKDS